MKKKVYLQQKKWMKRAAHVRRKNSAIKSAVENNIHWLNNAFKNRTLGKYYADFLREV